jgi:hypothetical protein
MDELMRQIATNAADYAVGKFGQRLPKGRQIRLWKRHYDNVYASLITFDDLQRARRVRAMAVISEN